MKRIYFFFAALGLAFLTKGDRVLTKPIIIQGPVNQTVKLNDDVEFVCKVLASDVQIQWLKHYNVNGSFIDENGMPFVRKLQQQSDSEKLTIKSVGHDDEGWYTCLAANIVGRSYQSAWLSVEDRVLTKPIVVQGPVNQTVKLYNDVEFVCEVLGNDVQIQWMKHYKVNGTFIDENGVPFLRKLQSDSEKLTIKSVGHDDEGWYTCLAANIVGRSYQSAWLSVEGNHCRGNSCGECLSSGTSCGWCADNDFNTTNHSRCQDFRHPKLIHLCSNSGVIQPVSRLTKVKSSQLNNKNMLGTEKMWISLRKGGEETVRIDSRVPSTLRRKKSNVLLKIVIPTNAPLNFTLDADCNSKKILGKGRNKLICKKQRRRSQIFFKVKLSLRECIKGKGKTKVKLVMKIGKQKEVAHIYVNDLCKCKCVHKEKLKKCKFNGKTAVGKCYCERKPYRPEHQIPNQNYLPSLGSRNNGSEDQSLDDVKTKLPSATRASKIRCRSCPSQCSHLKDCAACVAFKDYGLKYKTKRECLDSCRQYTITRVDALTGDILSQRRCEFLDSRSCRFTFTYHTSVVNVLSVKECPDGQLVRK